MPSWLRWEVSAWANFCMLKAYEMADCHKSLVVLYDFRGDSAKAASGPPAEEPLSNPSFLCNVQGGFCKGCFGPSGPPPQEEVISARWATAASSNGRGGPGNGFIKDPSTTADASGTDGASGGTDGGFKSALMKGGGLELTAPWALAAVDQTQRAPPLHPYFSSQPDKHTRTHAIVGRAEAQYCKTPFFTWRLAGGSSALHVSGEGCMYDAGSGSGYGSIFSCGSLTWIWICVSESGWSGSIFNSYTVSFHPCCFCPGRHV